MTLDDSGLTGGLATASEKVKESSGQISGALSETEDAASGAGGAFSSMAGQFVAGQVIFAAGQKVLSALGDAVKNGVSIYEQFQTNQVQMATSLKATNDASGQSVDSMDAYADKLSQQTDISTNAINSAQLLMLNYKDIGENIFPEATTQIANLATVMSGGAVPSTQQMSAAAAAMGKALEDPTTGVAALKRAHIELSPAQTAVIKNLQKTGDMAGAQQQLLSDLAGIIGGKAAANTKTLAGEQAALGDEFEKIAISVGKFVSGLVTTLMPALVNTGNFLMQHKVILAALVAVVGVFAIALGVGLVIALYSAIAAMGIFTVVGSAAFWPIVAGAAALGAIVYEIIANWGNLTSFFRTVWSVIQSIFSGVGAFFGNIFTSAFNGVVNGIKATINNFISLIDGMIHGVNAITGLLHIPKIPDIPHFASGVSNFAGGLALVGEQGPELVNLPSGSSVMPAGKTASALRNNVAGNSTTYHIANVNLTTASAVNEFFNMGNRNTQLESMGGSPLAGTAGA